MCQDGYNGATKLYGNVSKLVDLSQIEYMITIY